MKETKPIKQMLIDDKITLGQCFNLAHAEILSRGLNPHIKPNELKYVTKKLYFTFKEIKKELGGV